MSIALGLVINAFVLQSAQTALTRAQGMARRENDCTAVKIPACRVVINYAPRRLPDLEPVIEPWYSYCTQRGAWDCRARCLEEKGPAADG